MKELTVKEIAEKAGIMSFETVKSRIRILKIQPIRKVGRTNVYSPGTVDKVKNFDNSVGRPKKSAPEQPPKPKTSPKKPKK
jgi:hypothetical protein